MKPNKVSTHRNPHAVFACLRTIGLFFLSVWKLYKFCDFVFVGELTAYCMGPSKASYCELQDNHDGTFVLKIKPQEPGKHVLQVKYGGEHVNGRRQTQCPDFKQVHFPFS